MDFEANDRNLLSLLREKQWMQAKLEATRDQDFVRARVSVAGFYEPKYVTTISPIHMACAHQPPVEVIEHFHDIYPEGISSVDSTYNRLPLHVAVIYGASMKVVSTLLKLNPQAARVPDRLGRLPIHYACRDKVHGDQYVRYLIKAYPDSLTVADNTGFLPLHVACRAGIGMGTIRMLIRSSPITITKKTKKGSTPIQCAKQADRVNQGLVIEILTQCLQETKRMMREHGYETIQDEAFLPSNARNIFGRTSLESDTGEAAKVKSIVNDGETLSLTEASEDESCANASQQQQQQQQQQQ